MRRTILALAAAALVACGAGRTGDGTTGIRGRALVGPSCPVEVQGSPCPPAPWLGRIEARTLDGELAGETSTDEEGKFSVPLAPGTYVVTASVPGGGPPYAPPERARVDADGFTEVTILLDSGIR